MARFPALTPSERDFDPGKLPVREYPTMSGVIWKRVYGNKVVGGTLTMTFRHVRMSTARLITSHYLGQNCTVDQFELHPRCADGCDDEELAALLLRPGSCRWAYAAAPKRRDVAFGLCTVTVELRAELPY
jgi:hypothetical protein